LIFFFGWQRFTILGGEKNLKKEYAVANSLLLKEEMP
jgi:hypothetical protein